MEILHYEQFLFLLTQCQKLSASEASTCVCMWELVKIDVTYRGVAPLGTVGTCLHICSKNSPKMQLRR